MKHVVLSPNLAGKSLMDQHLDLFAEAIAELDDIEAASKQIGVTVECGLMLLQRIARRLGPQAA